RRPGIWTAAAREATDRADSHVVIAHDLARKTDAGQAARIQHMLLGRGHHRRLPRNELDAARRAARVAAAGVGLVYLHVLFEGENHSLSLLDFDRWVSFDRQFGHPEMIVNSLPPQLPTPD